jgi:16S rRNA (adenine1518-N6/adenine1519-N6)-dimethyltransferase
MRPSLGQHFLRDPKVIQTILAAAELKASDTALEIGPGKAVLTEPLAARIKRLVAIELDRELEAKLKVRFQSQTKVEIIQGDFLKTDLNALFPNIPIKVLGNLPYSITSPIFEKLLAWPGWEIGVFLVQREVAERMRAKAGSRTYGLLSLAIQLSAEVESIAIVPPGAFAPPPAVHSSVIRLRRKAAPVIPPAEVADFFHFARAAFAHRRKTVANAVALETHVDKNRLSEWLLAAGIPAQARAEQITLETYAMMAPRWAVFRRENALV